MSAPPEGNDLKPSEDTVFDLLYPPGQERAGAAKPAPPAGAAPLPELAAAWAQRSPQEVATRLAGYAQKAALWGRQGSRQRSAFAQALADAVERPEAWLDAFLTQGLYEPATAFLAADVARRRSGWERRLESAMALDPLAETAATLVLELAAAPPNLLERALEEAARTPLLAEALALRRSLPLPSLRALLASRRWQTALAAALGEWSSLPQGEVRPELEDDWTAAVLRARTAEYEETPETVGLQFGLRLVLGGNPDLAYAWLTARLADADLPVYFSADSPFAKAVEALDRERRERLLGVLHEAPFLQSLLPHLVGGDADLFRRLLALPALAAYHLAPLRRTPEAIWEELALAALDSGHGPREVAEASLFRSTVGTDRWQERDRAYAALAAHPRADLREVGLHGRKRVEEEIRRQARPGVTRPFLP